MSRKMLLAAGITIAATAVAVLGATQVVAQMAPPTESKGVGVKLIGAMPLRPEIPDIGDRQLRMRIVTLAPGGVFAAQAAWRP